MVKEKKNEDLVEVFIPKRNAHDDKQYIAVNGKRILVQKGKLLRLKPEFAEAVKNAQAQSDHAEEFIARMAQE